ncbi:MAG: hypothetical protein Ta2A_14140 [Treponemataceae bacterium]|nr:MAG: hypothetical protein Ta2A_14140 [Treponemataceae bacterium]
MKKSVLLFFTLFSFSAISVGIFAQGYDLDWDARDYGDVDEDEYVPYTEDEDPAIVTISYEEAEEEPESESEPEDYPEPLEITVPEEGEEVAAEETESEPPFVFDPTLSVGLGPDFSGYKRTKTVPFSFGGVLNVEYRPFHFFSGALKVAYHTDVADAAKPDLHAVDLLASVRFWFLNLPKDGGPVMFFFDCSAGISIVKNSSFYSETDYSGSFGAGIRIYPVSVFFIEPYGAYTYPGVWSAGIVLGGSIKVNQNLNRMTADAAYFDEYGAEYSEEYFDEYEPEYSEEYLDEDMTEYSEEYSDEDMAEYSEEYFDEDMAEYLEE